LNRNSQYRKETLGSTLTIFWKEQLCMQSRKANKILGTITKRLKTIWTLLCRKPWSVHILTTVQLCSVHISRKIEWS